MKNNQSYDYWLKRQDERIAYSEHISNLTISNIADVYDDSLERVNKKMDNIIANYAKDIKMPKEKLQELLSQHDVNDLFNELTQDLIANGANTNANMEWLRGNYLKRLSTQDSIRLQINNERRIISHAEHMISTHGYTQTIEQTYLSMAQDLIGKPAYLSESAKNSMLSKRWIADKNYSERIWTNVGKLSKDVDKLINSSLVSGRSRIEIQNELANKYGVAKYRAETLVRTEMNHFANQTELNSYVDLGVTHYIYLATRDNRTSEMCSTLDDERFPVKEAQPGINYPPMHPNCRSTTVPDLDF